MVDLSKQEKADARETREMLDSLPEMEHPGQRADQEWAEEDGALGEALTKGKMSKTEESKKMMVKLHEVQSKDCSAEKKEKKSDDQTAETDSKGDVVTSDSGTEDVAMDDTVERQNASLLSDDTVLLSNIDPSQIGNNPSIEKVDTVATQIAEIKAQLDHKFVGEAVSAITSKEDLTVDIDNRLPYRLGWPLLPVLPVVTTRENVPNIFSPSGTHLSEFRTILEKHQVAVQDVEVAHRTNPGKQANKASLTLCVLVEPQDNKQLTDSLDVIQALRAYIQKNNLTLCVEIIDRRVFNGLWTFPMLSTDIKVANAVKKRRHGIIKILNDCQEPWTSVDFYYRGLDKVRSKCRPTVLVGTPFPNRPVWWDVILPEIREKCGDKLDVELVFREVVKY